MACDAFVSYTRLKDEYSAVTGFVARLQNELRRKSGDVGFTVFQDTSHIQAGQNWHDRLATELQSARVLLVLLSPTWVKSAWCVAEYKMFRAAEPGSPQRRLIVPLLWDAFPPAHLLALTPQEDQVLAELREIHHADWSSLQYAAWSSASSKKAVGALATSIISQL